MPQRHAAQQTPSGSKHKGETLEGPPVFAAQADQGPRMENMPNIFYVTLQNMLKGRFHMKPQKFRVLGVAEFVRDV